MKAILYKKGGRANAEFTDLPDPILKRNDLLVRVYASCICKPADFAHDGGYSVFGKYPLVPGHEWSGIVEAVGEEVKDFKVGDRVTADANLPCGTCYYCKRGEVRFCENNTPYGQHLNGGFAELIAVDQSLVYKIPDGVSMRAASMTELVGCAYNGVEVCDFHFGDEVLVMGAGASGNLLAQLAMHSNAARVVAIDSVQSKLDLLEKHGVKTVLVDRDDYSKHEAVLKEIAPHGFDVIIDSTADSDLITRTLDLVKRGGKFVNYAFINNTDAKKPVLIDTRMFVTREISFLGSSFQHYKFEQALRCMEEGKVNCDEIITDIYPLEDFFKGMDQMWNDPETIKVMIEPNGCSEGK